MKMTKLEPTEISRQKQRIRYQRWLKKHPDGPKIHSLNWSKKHRKPCRICGTKISYPNPGRKYCNTKCLKEAQKKVRKLRYFSKRIEWENYKTNLGCSICEYNKCGAALDFHHADDNKERRLTVATWKTKLGQKEINKCVLLCSNCHREEHHRLEKNGDI